MNDNYFADLFAVNCADHVEKKNGLSYLSWAWAWAEVKKRHPDATYKVYESANGFNYHHDGKTAWVKTGVTVNGIEHIEMLPVMDARNKSIPLESLTSFDVNKAIQRCLTKACARHGLGLYIYAGEDLPEDPKQAETATKDAAYIYRLWCFKFGEGDDAKVVFPYMLSLFGKTERDVFTDTEAKAIEDFIAASTLDAVKKRIKESRGK